MNHRNGFVIAACCSLFPIVAPPGALAQGPDAPDVVVDVNEAIYYYLQGDEQNLERSIALTTSALERAPDSRPALLFRALAHGQLGLLARDDKIRSENQCTNINRVESLRGDPAEVEALKKEIAELNKQRQAEGAEPADVLLLKARLSSRQRLLRFLEQSEGTSSEVLQTRLQEYRQRAHEAADRERDRYRQMTEDLERLIARLDRPEVVIELLDIVALSKIARIDESEAVKIKEGTIASEDASGPVRALRASSADILKRIAGRLEDLLPSVSGEDAVRTKFFLGVIRYRQAVPRRAAKEPPAVNHRVLSQAEQVMTELADDTTIDRTWRSYAALYLGLIIPFRANLEPEAADRDRVLDEADRRLMQAAELDVRKPDDPVSATGGLPDAVLRQRDHIRELRKRKPSVPRSINDIQLSFYAGTHRDTNVVLLGERTDLPRDISRKRDFGFAFGTIIDYTLTLSDRWTFGAQGRTTQLWHADVDEFDEQRYGASVALQYEALPQRGDTGPLYMRLQYDYDYTLLGRSAFLESQVLTPNLRMFWLRRRAETNLYFRYELRDYREPLFDRRFDRDGEYLAVGLSQSLKTVNMTAKYQEMGIEPWGHPNDGLLRQDDPEFPARYLTPYIGLEYTWDATDGDEFDQQSWILSAGATIPLPWGVLLDSAVGFEWQDYSHGSLIDFHRRGREDMIQRYDIGLSRTFVLRGGAPLNRYRPAIDRVLMTVRGGASWTLDDSNVVDRLGQAIFEYDRVIYGLTVGFTFN